jgi:formate dehydrogenase subunit gamma
MDEPYDTLQRVLAGVGDRPGALLPVLHAVQDALGHIPPELVAPIASALNLSPAEVHGVICFFPHFRERPRGRHVVQLCRAEACQAVGAGALAERAARHLNCDFHGTSADGAVSLEPVHCLGQCAAGPALMIDEHEVHGRVSPERLDALLARLEEKS